MKTRLLAIAILALVSGPVSGDGTPKWEKFTSKEGRFSVRVPGKPKEGKQTIRDRTYGNLMVHSFEFSDKDFAVVCVYTDYPAAIKKAPAKDTLDAFRENLLKGGQSKLVAEKDIKHDNHPGRELQWVPKDEKLDMVGYAHVFVVDQRVFGLVIVGTKKTLTAKQAGDFFGSFQIVAE